MLRAFIKTKEIYEKMFGESSIEGIQANIERDINDDLKNKIKDIPQWFVSPYYAQVIDDAYKTPACVYPDPTIADGALSFLPDAYPQRPKAKVRACIIQSQGNVHWAVIVLRHLKAEFPCVIYKLQIFQY